MTLLRSSDRSARSGRDPRVRWLVAFSLLLTAGSLWLGTAKVEREAEAMQALSATSPWKPALGSLQGVAADRVQYLRESVPISFSLRRGDTLGGVLEDLGLDAREASQAIDAVGQLVDLRRLRAGDPATAFYGYDNRLAAFELTLRQEGKVRASLEPRGWRADWQAFEISERRRLAVGELVQTLEGALRQAGAPALVAYQMADVLQWDLDFNRDLQRGDRFRVIFEEKLVDGRPHGLGKIQALIYTTRGRALEAYRFDDAGYYDAEGHPLRKMFLRSPLKYSRVTSGFSQRRFHPVLKTYRPHYGVDFGAPTGTPIRVTASGVVASAARDKASGRMVKVRHANGYLTAYLHLSGYAKGIRSGVRVEQGEVIGYVGSTGLATAPHLDYRVQLKGRWINPMSLVPEPALPVAEDRMKEFLAGRDAQRVELAFMPQWSPEPPKDESNLAEVQELGPASSAPSAR